MRLEEWSIVVDMTNPYLAPEQRMCLSGKVYGHREHDDGSGVITSRIELVDAKTETVSTVSGLVYELGEVDEAYEREFPDAKKRLFARDHNERTEHEDRCRTLMSGISHSYADRVPQDWAGVAACGILYDLCDRRGIKNGFIDVDEDIREEIVDTMARLIRLSARFWFVPEMERYVQNETSLDVPPSASIILQHLKGLMERD